MALTADDYRLQLGALLPTGPAWETQPGDPLDQLLDSLSVELARVDKRTGDLLTESDPRATYEILQDWEVAYNLPDECTVGTPPLAERIARLVNKYTMLGGQSRAFFIKLASDLGYPGATITEYKPFTTQSRCNDSLTQGAWVFAWLMTLAQTTRVTQMTATSSCSESIRSWGSAELECVIRKLAPAHTVPLFKYLT